MEYRTQQVNEAKRNNDRSQDSELSISSVASDTPKSSSFVDMRSNTGHGPIDQSQIHEQLLMLQREIQEMSLKLDTNEQYLEEKRAENQQLQKLVNTLKHKVDIKKSLKIETKGKSGCCNQSGCIMF